MSKHDQSKKRPNAFAPASSQGARGPGGPGAAPTSRATPSSPPPTSAALAAPAAAEARPSQPPPQQQPAPHAQSTVHPSSVQTPKPSHLPPHPAGVAPAHSRSAPPADAETRAAEADDASAQPAALEQTLPPVPQSVPLQSWRLCGDAIIGLKHRRDGLPCQDAVAYEARPRPLLAISDGAGSAAVSDKGAQALVGGILRLMLTLEEELADLLDTDADAADLDAKARRWAERLHRHAHGLLADLARRLRRDIRDLRATLLVVTIGTRRLLWWQVGDGVIVLRTAAGLQALSDMQRAKGEFANQTVFVDTARFTDVQYGLLPIADIDGIALMSDGGAERLVAQDGSRVAARLASWLDELAQQRFGIERLALAFHEREMWERTSLDDRTLLMAARLPQALASAGEAG